MSLLYLPEESYGILRVTTKDENGDDLTPDGIRYRIDCETNGLQILEWTDYPGPFGTTCDIDLSPQETRILDGTNKLEVRQVQIEVTYDTDKTKTIQYRFEVHNRHAPMVIRIVQGDEYMEEGRLIVFTGGYGWGNDLTGQTIVFSANHGTDTLEVEIGDHADDVLTGARKVLVVPLTSVQTAALRKGTWKYRLVADDVTLTTGKMVVVEQD